MIRSLIAIGALIVTTAILSVATLIYLPYRGYSDSEKFVMIPRAGKVSDVGRILESNGVVRSAFLFTSYFRVRHAFWLLKAGEYRFDRPMSMAAVASKVGRGEIYYHRVTIPEGFTLNEIASTFVRSGFGEKARFLDVTRRRQYIADLDSQAKNLEGYLFPNTYFLTRGTEEEEIIRMMVKNFRTIWTPERRKQAQQLNFTVPEIVTLASLIEKETAVAEERPLVSAVFHNRLRKNLRLACDPTVIYAVALVKPFDGVINQSDLKIDSPYNTYLYQGLPPGPIANPGVASIDAALRPAPVDYLYFVSRNDGSHTFSTSLSDHNRAVRLYQR